MELNIGFDNFSGMEPGALLVVVVGLGTVFFGLIALIVLCKIFGLFAGNQSQTPQDVPTPPSILPAHAPAIPAVIPNKQELLAAISAAIAEDLGVNVNAIRIHSIKQVSPDCPACVSPNQQEVLAAVSAAVAEDLGTDVQAIRIHSFKKI